MLGGRRGGMQLLKLSNQILSGQASETAVGNSSHQASPMPDALTSVSRTMIKNTDSQELSSQPLHTHCGMCVDTDTHIQARTWIFKNRDHHLIFCLYEGNQIPGYSLITKRSTWWPGSEACQHHQELAKHISSSVKPADNWGPTEASTQRPKMCCPRIAQGSHFLPRVWDAVHGG